MAVRFKRRGDWHERTFGEVAEVVDAIALGLIGLGLEPGDRVCIMANTRVEWTYASLAAWSAGLVTVPIYPTSSARECAWVASDSGARAAFCEDRAHLARLEQAVGGLPALQTKVLFDHANDAWSLDRLVALGGGVDPAQLERRRAAVDPDDLCTIIYTSGTTGLAKGVALTHRNCSVVAAMFRQAGLVVHGDVCYLYLPLAHVFALIVQIVSFDVGNPIIYFGGDPDQILGELAETRPTYFPSVPRIFEKIYTRATAALEQMDGAGRARFEGAVELGVRVREMDRRGERVPAELRAAFEQADESIYANVRSLFGGRIRLAVSGGAPIAPEILNFFYACGVLVLEGWGMTETTGLGCLGTPDDFKFGTVGRPVPGLDLRIAGDGEILVRGPNVFREYWNDPAATRAVVSDDGWLHTGDLGEADEDGCVSITGRTKDLIVTAGGKKLAPANLENDLRRSRWISQAVVFGERKPYAVALVTLDPTEVLPWATARGLPEDLAALASDPQVRELIQAEIDAANAGYASFEQVKRFAILERDFTSQDGETTPTMKVKRAVVYERHAPRFEALYRGN